MFCWGNLKVRNRRVRSRLQREPTRKAKCKCKRRDLVERDGAHGGRGSGMAKDQGRRGEKDGKGQEYFGNVMTGE